MNHTEKYWLKEGIYMKESYIHIIKIYSSQPMYDSYINPRQTLVCSFYGWCTERLNKLFKITELKCDSAQIYESKCLQISLTRYSNVSSRSTYSKKINHFLYPASALNTNTTVPPLMYLISVNGTTKYLYLHARILSSGKSNKLPCPINITSLIVFIFVVSFPTKVLLT